jgi:hypothetical protein
MMWEVCKRRLPHIFSWDFSNSPISGLGMRDCWSTLYQFECFDQSFINAIEGLKENDCSASNRVSWLFSVDDEL